MNLAVSLLIRIVPVKQYANTPINIRQTFGTIRSANFGGITVKATTRNWKSTMLVQVISTILLANFNFAGANSQTLQIAAGNKAKVKGSILFRKGELIRVREKKQGARSLSSISQTIPRLSARRASPCSSGTPIWTSRQWGPV
jgi:hypothetical protein